MKFSKRKKRTQKFRLPTPETLYQESNMKQELSNQNKEAFSADNIGLGITYLLFGYLAYKYAIEDLVSSVSLELNIMFSDVFYDIALVLEALNRPDSPGWAPLQSNLPILRVIEQFMKFIL